MKTRKDLRFVNSSQCKKIYFTHDEEEERDGMSNASDWVDETFVDPRKKILQLSFFKKDDLQIKILFHTL